MSTSLPLRLSVDCGGGIKLDTSFVFEGGRYRHTIQLFDGEGTVVDQWEEEANSLDDDWPASPPIQQISREMINQRATLLGVGQAGKSHWSISVETVVSDLKPALKFDLACRTRLPPLWLGSTYRREPSFTDSAYGLQVITDLNSTGLTKALPPSRESAGMRTRISLKPLPFIRDSDSPTANATFVASCSLEQSSSVKYPATFRWSYLIAFASAP